MASEREVQKFVKSQQSIHLYKNVQKAFREVLLKMPAVDFQEATKNLILMVLHEGALGQVMHFPKMAKFRIMQLTVPKNIPFGVLKYVIAHEFGHIMQNRNWRPSDENKLEADADKTAERWGFPLTKNIDSWIDDHRAFFKKRFK